MFGLGVEVGLVFIQGFQAGFKFGLMGFQLHLAGFGLNHLAAGIAQGFFNSCPLLLTRSKLLAGGLDLRLSFSLFSLKTGQFLGRGCGLLLAGVLFFLASRQIGLERGLLI